jgi:hypothetical protein
MFRKTEKANNTMEIEITAEMTLLTQRLWRLERKKVRVAIRHQVGDDRL